MSSVYCAIEKIGHVLTSLIPVDPPLALMLANNQSRGKKLAGSWRGGEQGEMEAEEKRTQERKQREQFGTRGAEMWNCR